MNFQICNLGRIWMRIEIHKVFGTEQMESISAKEIIRLLICLMISKLTEP